MEHPVTKNEAAKRFELLVVFGLPFLSARSGTCTQHNIASNRDTYHPHQQFFSFGNKGQRYTCALSVRQSAQYGYQGVLAKESPLPGYEETATVAQH